MARRWTPQRFVMLRRIRVAVCVAAVTLASVGTFGVTARKSVALSVNGQTTHVTTYAMSVDRLLEERGIDVKSHDLVQSTSGGNLANHAVVTVKSAYQTTIVIDSQEVPFWTVADSAEQLLGFFESNEADAAKVTVDIKNVYNKLTGGLVINQDGPVTVIADGKSIEQPDGRLPAASLLDAAGVVVGKEDRVSVEKEDGRTVLRVRRVTHGQETRTEAVPFSTQTVVDPSLAPGQVVVQQQGVTGEITRVFNVTYVDGVAESEELVSETTTKLALDQIIAVGPEPAATPSTEGPSEGSNSNKTTDGSDGSSDNGTTTGDKSEPGNKPGSGNGTTSNGGSSAGKDDDKDNDKGNNSSDTGKKPATPDNDNSGNNSNSDNSSNSGNSSSNSNNSNNSNNSSNSNKPSDNGNSGNSGNNGSNGNAGNSGNTGNNSSNNSGIPSWARLWHPTVAQAKAYARGAAAQRGWTGSDWDIIEWLWTKESGWRWDADNPWSDAYGIPQALPGSKMGFGWKDDGAVQIDWGLSYIAQRYGNPTKAKQWWYTHNWY